MIMMNFEIGRIWEKEAVAYVVVKRYVVPSLNIF
jgi:hypothetical protein